MRQLKKSLLSSCFMVGAVLLFMSFISPKEEWYTHSNKTYKIDYPMAWKLDTTANNYGVSFFLFAPLENDSDTFRENINLIVQDPGEEKITLEEFVKISTDQIKNMLSASAILRSEKITSGGKEGWKIIYEGNQSKKELKWQQYYWVVDNKAYVLTFTAEQSSYSLFEPVAQRIMESFLFRQ